MLRTLISFVVLMMVLASAVNSMAEELLRKAAWIEGGSTLGGDPGGAIGIRLWNVGVKLGYGGHYDYASSNVMDAYPFDIATIGGQGAPLGRKKIDPAWGFDMMGFYDVTKQLSLYGEGGLYFQDVRQVKVVTKMPGGDAGTIMAMSWHVGTLYNSEMRKTDATLQGGAGLQYTFTLGRPKIGKLPQEYLVTAGYHTMRGLSCGIGLAW